jgi:UDPglucose 6-dehydrogenase
MKKETQLIKKICCIGAGYVGGPSMAIIAAKCDYLDVTVVDKNKERISQWNNKDLTKLPVYEPDLDKLISKTRDINLHFTSDIEKTISDSDIIFISVNTPTKQTGLGAGEASDLKWVESCTRLVAKHARNHTIVVEKSTIPVRTAEVIKTILQANQSLKNKKTFSVLSNPEFLSEGSAIKDLENPDRVLIGGEDKNAIEILASIYLNWVKDCKIIRTNLWSSELSKLAANAFLAQRISSINAIGAICEVTGADVREVKLAIGSDKRIGEKFLEAGPGFGGSCFKKDLLNLIYFSRYFGLPEVSKYWGEVINLNNWQRHRISKLVVEKLFGTISSKKIIILGFAFKANTNDTRESPAIQISNELLDEGANLEIHDPKVSNSQIEKDIECFSRLNKEVRGKWSYVKNFEESFRNADAAIILTEWEEYRNLDWEKFAKLMRRPAWIFDSRSITNPKKLKKLGLEVWRVGDGTLS